MMTDFAVWSTFAIIVSAAAGFLVGWNFHAIHEEEKERKRIDDYCEKRIKQLEEIGSEKPVERIV